MVVVLTQKAIDSPHVLREVERASSKKRGVLSMRLDSAPLPAELEYFLSSNHWLDASGGPVERVFPALAGLAPAVAESRPTQLPKKPLMLAGGALALIAVAALVAQRLWLRPAGTITVPAPTPATEGALLVASEKSIAVLPFADMSEKHDQEYFSDGMAEEIIDLLVKVPELKVPARTSSFYFKGKSTKIQDIAKELGVAHILEGSVRKSGDHLRVTAQLVRADNGFHLWSETYDRQLEDVFKTQDEIAGSVVKALKVSLLKTEMSNAQPTTNSQAYELYLQARELRHQGGNSNALNAYADLKQAVSLDPNFALAWAGLANMLAQDNINWTPVFAPAAMGANGKEDLTNYASVWNQARAAAHAAADRAIALGPTLGEAHAAKAYVLAWLDWQWADAEVEFATARELDPTNARILFDFADINMALGRLAEGLEFSNRGVALDPLSGGGWGSVSYAQFALGKLQPAERAARKSIEVRGDSGAGHYNLANVLLIEGQAQQALDEYRRDSGANWRDTGIPLALDALGRRAEADQLLAAAEPQWGNGMAYQIACVYAGRKDLDRAFSWLDRAYRQRDGGLTDYPLNFTPKRAANAARFLSIVQSRASRVISVDASNARSVAPHPLS